MPSALRSEQHMLGLPGLVGKDLAKVKQGNNMYFKALGLIKLCLSLGIPGYLENPASSRVFKMKGCVGLVKSARAQLVRADMCQYGVAYKKPTLLLVWGVPPGAVTMKVCKPVHGRCSCTGKKHIQLSGIEKGKFITSAAQVYPLAFSEALMGL